MRESLWPVEQVGRVPASAASAAVTALEYHCNRIGQPPTNLSTQFVHYNARQANGDAMDRGTTLAAVLEAIKAHGACRDESWPLDESRVGERPPDNAYAEAKTFANIQYFNPIDIHEALALRYPVPFVAHLPQRCLEEAGRTGMMPAPAPGETPLVSHAMVVVGYDKSAGTVLARNCWGAEWGDRGHCTIPMDVMSVIAPYGTGRLWVIATADSTVAAARQAAGPQPAQPEKLSDMAARMRQEIRGDLQKDIADSTQRIRDMLKKKP